jgi:hypothetical protein
MIIPGPNVTPSLMFTALDKFMAEFEGQIEPVYGGIAIYGPAASYGLVWEFGSSRMKKPGPKTLWGVNPLGEPAILSKQAPAGYIAIHEDEFWPIILEEMSRVEFRSDTPDGIKLELEIAMDNASQRIARIVSDSAPVDSGDLRAGIQLVDDQSWLREQGGDEADSTSFFF